MQMQRILNENIASLEFLPKYDKSGTVGVHERDIEIDEVLHVHVLKYLY